MGRIYASLGEWDWRSRFSQLHLPVLTIHGDQDPIPLAAAHEWAALLPQGRLLVIPEAGHFPFIEQPDPFFAAVERFLQGEWPVGTTSRQQDGVAVA